MGRQLSEQLPPSGPHPVGLVYLPLISESLRSAVGSTIGAATPSVLLRPNVTCVPPSSTEPVDRSAHGAGGDDTIRSVRRELNLTEIIGRQSTLGGRAVGAPLHRLTYQCHVELEWFILSDLDGPSPPLPFEDQFGGVNSSLPSTLPPRLERMTDPFGAPVDVLASYTDQFARVSSALNALRNNTSPASIATASAALIVQDPSIGHLVHSIDVSDLTLPTPDYGDARVYVGVMFNSGEHALGEDADLLGGYSALQEAYSRLQSASEHVTPNSVAAAINRPLNAHGCANNICAGPLPDGMGLTHSSRITVEHLDDFTAWNNAPPAMPPPPPPPPPPKIPPPAWASPPPPLPPPPIEMNLSVAYALTGFVLTIVMLLALCGCFRNPFRSCMRLPRKSDAVYIRRTCLRVRSVLSCGRYAPPPPPAPPEVKVPSPSKKKRRRSPMRRRSPLLRPIGSVIKWLNQTTEDRIAKRAAFRRNFISPFGSPEWLRPQGGASADEKKKSDKGGGTAEELKPLSPVLEPAEEEEDKGKHASSALDAIVVVPTIDDVYLQVEKEEAAIVAKAKAKAAAAKAAKEAEASDADPFEAALAHAALADPCRVSHAPTTARTASPPPTKRQQKDGSVSPSKASLPSYALKAYAPRAPPKLPPLPPLSRRRDAEGGKLPSPPLSSDRAPLSSPSSGKPTRRLAPSTTATTATTSSGTAARQKRRRRGASSTGAPRSNERDPTTTPSDLLPPTLPLNAASLKAREASEAAAAADARARMLTAPPSAHDFEVLLDVHVPCTFYSYNDILIRSDPPTGVAIEPELINSTRTYMQVEGYPPIGPQLVDIVPRLFVYNTTSSFHMLHLGGGGSGEGSSALKPIEEMVEREDVSSCEVYRVDEGVEATRRITLLRRRWPNEKKKRQKDESLIAAAAAAVPAAAAVFRKKRVGRGAGSACALCAGTHAHSYTSSTLPPAVSEHGMSEASERGRPETQAALRQTERALKRAAEIREEDAGKVWPGGVPVGEVTAAADVAAVAATPAAVDRATLDALLGFPDELDA